MALHPARIIMRFINMITASIKNETYPAQYVLPPAVSKRVRSLTAGLRFTNVFSSPFKFDGNIVSLSPRIQYSDRYHFLYMAQQLCCRCMCQIFLLCDGQQRNYSQTKLPSNLIAGKKKTLLKRAPGPPSLPVNRLTLCMARYAWKTHKLCVDNRNMNNLLVML